MATTSITFRTDAKLAKRIAALAASYDRSRNWVIEDALKRYMEDEKEQIKGIKDGLEWFESNEGIPHEAVMKKVRATINRYRK